MLNNPRTLQLIPNIDLQDVELTAIKLALVVPEASVNYFPNPSVEVNTNNFGSKVAPARDTTVAAYGLNSLKITPLDTTYQTLMSLWLPDGDSDLRLSGPFGNLNVNLFTSSSVSFEIAGKPNEVVTATIEPAQAIDFFNRTGTLAGSTDGTGKNTWSVSGANLTLQNNRVEATGVVDASNARIGNHGGFITGNIEADVVGIFTSGVVGAWPVLMQIFQPAGTKWIGIRLETSAIRILGYSGGVETSLASAAFSPVTGTVYNIRAEVTYNGTNYIGNVYVNNALLIANYTYNNADLVTYGGNQTGIWLTVKGAPVGAVPYFDNFLFTIPQYTYASKRITLTSGWQRVSLSFFYPFITASPTFLTAVPLRQVLILRKNTATLDPFWVDAFSYENKAYSTTYFDGDFDGTWDGLPGQSSSTRAVAAGGGKIAALTDLAVKVTAIQGAGMPPLNNQSIELASSGGESYQKTLARKRPVNLICVVNGDNAQDLARKMLAVENCFTPDALSGAGKNTKLLYQIVDPITGAARSPVLQSAAMYRAGMEGSKNNDYQQKFVIQLEAFQTPDITEVYPKAVALPNPVAGGFAFNLENARINGRWNSTATLGAGTVRTVYIDRRGAFWFGYTTGAVNQRNTNDTSYPALTVTGATTTPLAFLQMPNGYMYVAGDFTSPGNYFIRSTGGGAAFAQAGGATWNGVASCLAALPDGRILIGGLFNLPFANLAVYDPATNVASAIVAGLNGTVFDIVVLPDGSGFYFTGNFTTSTAVAVLNRIGFYNLKTATLSALGTGLNNTGRALALGANNKLYIGGDFTTAGGAAISNIAAWNGSSFEAVGASSTGLDAPVYDLAYNPADGMLYAAGNFLKTGTRSLTPGLAKFNGTIWLPCDAVYTPGTSINLTSLSISPAAMLLGAASYGAGTTYYPATLKTVVYTGTAGAPPKIVLDNSTGTTSCQLFQLNNYSTGKTLYLDYTVAVGEILTIYITATGVKITSNYGGDRVNAILPGSDVSSFGLAPGANLFCFTTGARPTNFNAYMLYKNTHWSFNGGVY
jgi:hypothetical protein